MDSLEIGKVIATYLTGNEELNAIINNKVYPIVADQGTTYPFVVYKRGSLQTASSKDRYNYSEVADVEMVVASKSYRQSVEIATKIRDVLDQKRGVLDNININEIRLENAYEDYMSDTDVFVQYLTFRIEIIK